jgi:hypothetical protein
MHGYKDFFNDVNESFKSIIDDYSPEISYFNDDDFGKYAVEMNFKNCKLLLDLDRMNLQAKFINPKTNEQYHVMKVFEVLDSNVRSYSDTETPDDKKEKIKLTLQNLAIIIDRHLQHILKGDFSWKAIYSIKEEGEASILKKLWSLDVDDPIYKKFQAGDMSWMDDVKNRMK